MPHDEELEQALKIVGQRLGTLHGAKNAAALNARLTPKQRSRNASKAGKAASANLTKDERKARARAAAQAMWAKKRAAAKAKKK